MVESRSHKLAAVVRWLFIIVSVVFTLAPILWMVNASLKINVDILNPDKLFFFTPTFKNYREVFTQYNLAKPLWNSLVISGLSTVAACTFALPAAYAIARFKQTLFSTIVLIIRVLPAILFLVPWHIMFSAAGISYTFFAMVLAYTIPSLPMIIWIMIPYYESVPRELEESARIDGSSHVGAFFRIILPLSTPGIFTAALLTLIGAWNNFLYALILSGNSTRTLPMAVFGFISYTKVDWDGMMAAAAVITLPIILISLLLQKYVVGGLTAGAVKG